MFPFLQKKTSGSASTQIAIKEVRDNILVLPGKRCRAILATSSVNFELQSETEQDALIDNFQSFLNSLTTPIQILIRIRELDIEQYLENLNTSCADEDQMIYKQQGNQHLLRLLSLLLPLEGLISRLHLFRRKTLLG